ncbi:hypothetical protein C8N46_101668 [Kordia periserrulae]|uniref:Uncharacterized protein n=1 Tax=Kordia periserrulae TaxID=701523 RepID=A0A2T6C6V8_9FLAO|nr:hypothetical protein [Kordia periserrulae]PTX64058.1 hypothetical protein C8N46_101668 [Kordia periserrulae]
MSPFNQHTALLSLENALVPNSRLVDSRTEMDNLRLLVDFASLFNFYDQNNKINGTWSPFLLKDPVFLVASIAKTTFQKAYSLFINTCLQLEKALQTDVNTSFISNGFNQLFNQLTYVFRTIERWTYYMQQSDMTYNLKTYVIQQVKEKQSALLWAVLALQTDLNLNKIIPNMAPVDTYLYKDYDQKIWKDSKGKEPYWKLLNLQFSPEHDVVYYFFKDVIILVKELWTVLKEPFSKITEAVFSLIKKVFTALVSTLKIMFEKATTIFEKVVKLVDEVFAFLDNIIQKIIHSLKEKLQNFKASSQETDTISTLVSNLQTVQNSLKNETDSVSFENIQTVIQKIEALVTKVAAFVLKFGKWFFEIVVELVEIIANTIADTVKEIYKLLKEIIQTISTKQVRLDIFNGLKGTGKSLFTFYSKCISYAGTELKTLQEVPGHFPDTILLRTFTNLMKIYQKQFNSLAEKHLHFYYHDILKQTPNSVSPDSVFACSNLAKKTATYQLNENTIFLAGTDANKQPILFETTNKTSLNPAKIVNSYVLSQPTIADNTQLYLEKLAPVNVVAKNEAGAIASWKTFGSSLTPQGTPQELAMTFGSPMFYMTEAKKRTITLSFTFSNCEEINFSQPDFTLYLSTKKDWFKVPVPTNTSDVIVANQIQITLQPTDPIIEAFTKNPDGYSCEWPLLKIVFPNYDSTYASLEISTLDITVHSEELQNFQLYNDFGQLNPKKPFQLLGGAPKVNESFMIGNAEIFSKPLQNVNIQLTWNPFAPNFNFADYYKEYNDYLKDKYSGEPLDVEALLKKLKAIETPQDNFITTIINKENTLFTSLKKAGVSVSDATNLITTNITEITSEVSAQTKTLNKSSSTFHTLVTEIITDNTNMERSITSELNTLKNTITTAKKIDAATVDATAQSITNKINSTKNSVDERLLEKENSLLSSMNSQKKSLFQKFTSLFKKHKNTPLLEIDTFQFSNNSFFINFQQLKNGVWTTIETAITKKNQEGEAVTKEITSVPLFSVTDSKLAPTKELQFLELNTNPTAVDATLQKVPLQLTETTATGFIKMKLFVPNYGFGTDLYPKVVAAIALYNAQIIAEKIKDSDDKQTLVAPPNIPFVPTVSAFTGSYTAQVSYDFSKATQDYPLQCFYNTPFANFKVFDTNLDENILAENTTIGVSPKRDASGKIIPLKTLPFLPTIAYKGALFLELQDVIAPAKVSFYVELARAYTEQKLTPNTVSYSYLSTDGWKLLTSIEDGTNNFTCSGIITIAIPSDITTNHDTFSGTNYWISIATNDNLDSFPETSFLNTNGFTLQRILAEKDFSTKTPQIAANTITSPQTAIPAIAATMQPFASFDGKAAETNMQMNSRVSTRLKTKDRLVTFEDFFNAIRLEFPSVYYSKTVYNKSEKQAYTYVVKRVADVTDTNAFEPLLSECKELKIQEYITDRTSPFVTVSVSNFELKYVKITATIQVQPEEDVTTVAKDVNNGINLFLAPWITSAQSQIIIDQGLNTAQLATFINSYATVLDVNDISFQIGTKDFSTGEITYGDAMQEVAATDGIVLVPSLNNTTKNSTITYQ